MRVECSRTVFFWWWGFYLGKDDRLLSAPFGSSLRESVSLSSSFFIELVKEVFNFLVFVDKLSNFYL